MYLQKINNEDTRTNFDKILEGLKSILEDESSAISLGMGIPSMTVRIFALISLILSLSFCRCPEKKVYRYSYTG